MCFGPRRSLRRSRNAAIILPTSARTRCARAPPLLRRKLLRPFRVRRGGRHRSLGQRRLRCRARSRSVHRAERRSLHTLSVVALSATFRRESSSVASGGFANPPWRKEGVHGGLLHSSLFARCQSAVARTALRWLVRSSPVAPLRPQDPHVLRFSPGSTRSRGPVSPVPCAPFSCRFVRARRDR